MYLVFAMIAILAYASIMKVFFLPSLWTVEMAQFVMVAYFTLGGAYTLQGRRACPHGPALRRLHDARQGEDGSVRPSFVLIGFLVMLQIGGISSLIYSFQYGEKSFSSWAPVMWPVKVVLNIGIFLTLLQAVAIFFKDWASLRGEKLVMSYGLIATLLFSSMMLLLLTGQRIFAVIGFVGAAAAVLLWGEGGIEIPFTSIIKVMKWYPLLTLPLFVFMGYMLAESKIADDLYKMFHVWMGRLHGGLAVGTIFMMVIISAINGLSVAGMAVGATIALPALLQPRLRQDHGHRRHPGRLDAGHPHSAQRRAGALRHDRTPAGRQSLDGRRVSGPADGDAVHSLRRRSAAGCSRTLARRCRRRSATSTRSPRSSRWPAPAWCRWSSSSP